jgi:glycine C-acetyltransferase
MKDNALSYSLADFFYNDSKSVLTPPADYLEWTDNPRVQEGFAFFHQQLLEAPRAVTTMRSNFDGKVRKVINLTSYNYLGLSTHPEVIEAAIEGLKKYGMSASGAPHLSGTFDVNVKFCKMIADLKQKEDAIIFSSGLGGNVGGIQGLMRKGDLLVMDEKCHKSLVDGGTLSGAKMIFFKHNDIGHLAEILEKNKGMRTLVVAEGVYSMDGDLVKLPEMVEVLDQYPDIALYMDEAHSSLMFGKTGAGIGEHFGLEHKIGVSYGTLSKSFGGVGGFIASNERIIHYLRGYASPYNFSCAPSPAIVCGLIKSLEVATRDSSLRDKLWENTAYFKKACLDMRLDLGGTESQVIPIIIGSDGEMLFEMAKEAQLRGLFLQPVDFPAVPAHARRFRISMSSQLTKEDMDTALNVIEDVIAKKMKAKGLLK